MGGVPRSIFVAVLLTTACGSKAPIVAPLDPGKIAIDVTSVEFPVLFVGDKATRNVRVQNQGRVAGQVQTQVTGPFAVVQGEGATIAPGDIATVALEFAPAAAGDAMGTLTISVPGLGDPVTVNLTGSASGRSFTVDSSVTFDDLPLGQTARKQLEVKSTSLLTFVVQVTMAGSESASFDLGQTALSLPPGKSAFLDLGFTPIVDGANAATITLKCDGCDDHSVQVLGTATKEQALVSPNLVDFGRVDLGVSAHHDVTVKSLGTIPVWFSAARFIDGPGTPFSIKATGLPVLIADQTITVGIDFTPQTDGFFSGILQLEVGDNVMGIPVSGSGGPGAVAVDPDPIDFGLRPVGSEPRINATILDALHQGFQVEEVRIDGDPGNVFHVTTAAPPIPPPVNAGVTLATTQAGSYTADLVILGTSNVERHVPITAIVTEGGVCNLALTPVTLRMGLAGVGNTIARAVTLHNKATTACGVTGFALSGSPTFSLVDAPPGVTTIPGGGDLDVMVQYQPAALSEALDQATLSFLQANPDAPKLSAQITGAGSVVDVRGSPNPVDFGQVPVGATTLVAVDLVNFAGPPVRIASQDIADDKSPVSITQAAPATLPAGEGAQTVQLAFHPASAGKVRTTLEVWLENTLEPVLIPVVAEGVATPCGSKCTDPVASCPGIRDTWPFRPTFLSGLGIDPANQAVTCNWTVIGAPPGSAAQPDSPASCTTGFTNDGTGDYDLQLDVADSDDNHATCTTRVHAAPFDGLLITTTWSQEDVVDLHLFDSASADPNNNAAPWRGGTADCWKGNPRPPWDAAGSDDDPALDAGSGQGPEMAWIRSPKIGEAYRIGVHKASSLFQPLQVTTNVYCGGALAGSVVQPFTQPYSAAQAATVTFTGKGTCTFTAKNFLPITVVP